MKEGDRYVENISGNKKLNYTSLEVIEMELTYENMKDFLEKWFDFLPKVEPKTFDEFRELFAPAFRIPHQGRFLNREEWAIGHIGTHHEVYRAHIYYKPAPLYIMVDDRKKMAACLITEEAKHPVTGEIVEVFKHHITGEPVGIIFMHANYELVLIDNAIKMKSEFLTRIDPKEKCWSV